MGVGKSELKTVILRDNIMNDKLSEWGSFFPNIKNNYVDRFIWHECYNEQIIDIFTIIKNIIRERYK